MGVITNGGKTKPNMRKREDAKKSYYIFFTLIST